MCLGPRPRDDFRESRQRQNDPAASWHIPWRQRSATRERRNRRDPNLRSPAGVVPSPGSGRTCRSCEVPCRTFGPSKDALISRDPQAGTNGREASMPGAARWPRRGGYPGTKESIDPERAGLHRGVPSKPVRHDFTTGGFDPAPWREQGFSVFRILSTMRRSLGVLAKNGPRCFRGTEKKPYSRSAGAAEPRDLCKSPGPGPRLGTR